MSDFREYLNKQLQDPEFKKEWDDLEPENANPALSTLKRLAEGMDMVLRLEFIPKNVIK